MYFGVFKDRDEGDTVKQTFHDKKFTRLGEKKV